MRSASLLRLGLILFAVTGALSILDIAVHHDPKPLATLLLAPIGLGFFMLLLMPFFWFFNTFVAPIIYGMPAVQLRVAMAGKSDAVMGGIFIVGAVFAFVMAVRGIVQPQPY